MSAPGAGARQVNGQELHAQWSRIPIIVFMHAFESMLSDPALNPQQKEAVRAVRQRMIDNNGTDPTGAGSELTRLVGQDAVHNYLRRGFAMQKQQELQQQQRGQRPALSMAQYQQQQRQQQPQPHQSVLPRPQAAPHPVATARATMPSNVRPPAPAPAGAPNIRPPAANPAQAAAAWPATMQGALPAMNMLAQAQQGALGQWPPAVLMQAYSMLAGASRQAGGLPAAAPAVPAAALAAKPVQPALKPADAATAAAEMEKKRKAAAAAGAAPSMPAGAKKPRTDETTAGLAAAAGTSAAGGFPYNFPWPVTQAGAAAFPGMRPLGMPSAAGAPGGAAGAAGGASVGAHLPTLSAGAAAASSHGLVGKVAGPRPTARDARFEADDVNKPDIADMDILAGVFDAVAEQQALLGTLNKPTVAEFAPKLQEEYALNEKPVLVRMLDIARRHSIKHVAPECFQYMALAVESHLTSLLTTMAKAATQRGDPAKDLPGMSKVGPNIRQGLGAIAKGDRLEKEKRAAEEQERLVKLAESRSKKLDEEKKAQIQQAKEQKQKTEQLEGARTVLGEAFAFKKKGGMFGPRGPLAKKNKKLAAGAGEKAGAGAGVKQVNGKAAASPFATESPANGAVGTPGGPATSGMEVDGEGTGPSTAATTGTVSPATAGRATPTGAPTAAATAAHRGSLPASAGRAANTSASEADKRLELVPKDLIAALERDSLLCRHPLLWRLHTGVQFTQQEPVTDLTTQP